MAGAKQLRQHYRAADIAAKCKSQINQRNFIGIANRRQGAVVDKLTGNEAVGDIIQLLKQDAAQQRQRKFQQHGSGVAAGQVFYQTMPSS